MTALERLALLASILLLVAAVVLLVVQWSDPSGAANWLGGGAVVFGLGAFRSVNRRRQHRP